ncbi:heparin lyase I family protein [Lysobacter enzymogenes]|uniref:heparin lyase I family protein n=1 Tax=Lysobacter enzymogenes TaxID=69 RepID=UPI0009D5B54D|nr:heparin lyase I family protein [Lysobacter enzymogenes]UZW58902.1 heparin lyase I family protein [Lysobacter enzymogenes]
MSNPLSASPPTPARSASRRIVAALMFALALACASAHAQTPLLRVDYETGTIDSGIPDLNTSDASAADAIFVSETARAGRYAIAHKVVLDDPAYVSEGKPRSESAALRTLPARYRSGDHRRYAFSVMLKDWEDYTAGRIASVDIVWQFKHTQGGADMFVGVRRNQLVLRYANTQSVLINDIRPYDNAWIDLRFDVLWADTPTGYFTADLRLPGESGFTRRAAVAGIVTLDPTATGAFGYPKWGLYRPDSDSSRGSAITRIALHDEISVTALPAARIRLNKAFAPSGRAGDGDQFALSIAPPAPAGTVSATTTGSGAQVTSPPALLVAANGGGTYVLSETAAANAPGTDLGRYRSAYACTNARAGGQAPRGDGASFALALADEDDLSCTFTNTRANTSDLAIAVTNTPAQGPGDQPDDNVVAGAVSTYRIQVSNHGPDAATGAIVRDAALAGLACADPVACAGAACPAATVAVADLMGAGVTLGELAGGASVSLDVSCRVAQ